MKRYLKEAIREDLRQKMVFVGGPRQVGKTTLALDIAPKRHRYLNWDVLEDREFILRHKFPAEKFVIYDEIHKFKQWRNYIKGLFDTSGSEKRVLVTGSARLDYYRHSGDSLQGRYHYYRLHPFTVGELGIESQSDFEELLRLGGFPEPFLSGSEREARRWMREYRSRVVNEEISTLELTQNLSAMELLLLRLPELVGSPLSINALREDLNLAHKTVSKWLDIFERMYLIYRLPPFGSNKLRAVKKEQKHYHYNWAEVPDDGARFENLVAGHLLKWVDFQQDYEGKDIALSYFRDVDRREIDFIITENGRPVRAVECKLKQKDISRSLGYFKARFPQTETIQVHLNGTEQFISKEGVKSMGWKSFLSEYL
ncbi:MAG: ATP-binding protein [Sedimenticola sp.]